MHPIRLSAGISRPAGAAARPRACLRGDRSRTRPRWWSWTCRIASAPRAPPAKCRSPRSLRPTSTGWRARRALPAAWWSGCSRRSREKEDWPVFLDTLMKPHLADHYVADLTPGGEGHKLWPALEAGAERSVRHQEPVQRVPAVGLRSAADPARARHRHRADHRHADQCVQRKLGARRRDVGFQDHHDLRRQCDAVGRGSSRDPAHFHRRVRGCAHDRRDHSPAAGRTAQGAERRRVASGVAIAHACARCRVADGDSPNAMRYSTAKRPSSTKP